MTKTITANITLTVTDTDIPRSKVTWSPGVFSQAFSGAIGPGNPGLVEIGSGAEEQVSFGDVVPGLVILYNTSPTNFATFTVKANGETVTKKFKLLPQGIPTLIYLVGSSDELWAIADTAAVKVQIMGYNA